MTSSLERIIQCAWEEDYERENNRIKNEYSNILKELNEKSVKYFYFSNWGEHYYRIWIKTNNSFNDYGVFGYDLIPLCNLIGIKFDIDKIESGYKFHRKYE